MSEMKLYNEVMCDARKAIALSTGDIEPHQLYIKSCIVLKNTNEAKKAIQFAEELFAGDNSIREFQQELSALETWIATEKVRKRYLSLSLLCCIWMNKGQE